MLDTANPVHKSEEIDSNAVTEYLMSQGIALQGQPEVTQFSGGGIQLDIPPKICQP